MEGEPSHLQPCAQTVLGIWAAASSRAACRPSSCLSQDLAQSTAHVAGHPQRPACARLHTPRRDNVSSSSSGMLRREQQHTAVWRVASTSSVIDSATPCVTNATNDASKRGATLCAHGVISCWHSAGGEGMTAMCADDVRRVRWIDAHPLCNVPHSHELSKDLRYFGACRKVPPKHTCSNHSARWVARGRHCVCEKVVTRDACEQWANTAVVIVYMHCRGYCECN